MLKVPDMLLLFCLLGAANALYKQWIPDTNYENKTNWDKGAVPCGNDVVQFSAQSEVSVYVETMHAVQELRLPVNGEFILNSGAGFYVVNGQDLGCGAGVTTQFKHPESLQWFNPALWQAAATLDEVQRGNFLFSVHEESVPCQYDDVIFKASSSFRVDTTSGEPTIPTKTVSVLGKTFIRTSEFKQYLSSRTGRLQFHGSSAVSVENPGCGDPTGCDCGNSGNHDRICGTVTCSPLTCEKLLRPVGHCCDVCGAIVTIQYTAGFNLETYRQRIQHLFLILPQYRSVQLGISKVFKSQRLMGIIPFGTTSEIQVVIVDGETESRSEDLARDIVKDAKSHSDLLGIAEAEFQASSGSVEINPGMVAGIVFGVLCLVLIPFMIVLARKGAVRMPSMPSMPSLSRFKRNNVTDDLGGPLDYGFDNPMFDKPTILPDIPHLHGTEINNSISMTQIGINFINPVYDDHETDFTA